MEMSVDIINQGEDAFNAMLYLQLPKEVNYNGAESTTPGLSVLCSPPSPMNNRTLQCDVGNPLPANTKVNTGNKHKVTNYCLYLIQTKLLCQIWFVVLMR